MELRRNKRLRWLKDEGASEVATIEVNVVKRHLKRKN